MEATRMKDMALIFLKSLASRIPALALIVALMLVLGQISAIALDETEPALRIAICQESDSDLAEKFVQTLYGVPNMDIVRLENFEDKDDLFRKEYVQGIVLVPQSFEENLKNGKSSVSYYTAPGITDVSAVSELIAGAILDFRIEMQYEDKLSDLGINASEMDIGQEETDPILSFVYDGPLLSETLEVIPPAFGVPSLFMLMAFLQAASSVFGSDMNRVKLRGRKALISSALIGIIVQYAYWAAAIFLYVLGLQVVFGIAVEMPVLLSLLGLAFYANSLGGFVAFIGLRRYSTVLFIPWLLLNMTFGGGLWNAIAIGNATAILPVSAVIRQSWSGASALWLLGIAILLIILFDIPQRLIHYLRCLRHRQTTYNI
jgi:hypothetical protein